MLHQETADAEHFEQVIIQAVRKILTRPDQDVFLTWARVKIPEILGLSEAHLDAAEARRLATMLATVIWNATPQPVNGFQPVPLSTPAPDSACTCGSGLSYRLCCGNVDDMPELSSELVWEVMLDELSEGALREAIRLGVVPAPLLSKIADRWLDQDRPRRVVDLLEPLFAGALDGLDARYEPALDILCDAYDRLDHWRKKLAFLDRVCSEGSRAMQAAAWQRRSTIHIDEGDYARAETAFTAALRSNPDNPSTALLEITLLAAQHKDWLAQERARFWLHRLKRLGYRDEGFMDFLERAAINPQDAMVTSHADTLDPVLVDLHDWMSVISERPLPAYSLVKRKSDKGARRQRAAQPDLFDDTPDEEAEPVHRALEPVRPSELRPPPRVRQLESFWRALYPGEKPYSTHLSLLDGADVWTESGWVDYLLGHPEVADSLEVLDDLATALYEHPESALPWISHALLKPLLERAWAILMEALPREDPHILPWAATKNRSALRLVFRRYLCQIQEGQAPEAVRTLETLLRLNPQDNHGARAELMNHYLRDGEDERALALAQRFPDDLLADLAYGEVLALYRLGRQDRARSVLKTAVRRLPRIPQYLTRKRIKQPRLSPLGVTPGGEDQAWLYREAMLDVWAAEPGILAWLKRCTVR